MKIIKNNYLIIVFLGVLLPFTLRGQSSEVDLDSIWKEIDLEDIVITAQYAPTDSKNAIHNVKVIKAKDISAQGLNNLEEVLTNQLNFRVSTDPILGSGLKIQGVGGENVQILIDGVPVIGRVGGNIDLSQINLNNIDRIEIVKGAMSAQYGSNASGGVINLITKKSQVKPINFESNNQYESIGILSNAIRLGTQFGKLYTAINLNRINYQFADIDSLRLIEEVELSTGDILQNKKIPWNPKVQYGIDGILRYRFSDSLNVVYQYRYFKEDLSIYGRVRRPTFRPYAFDDHYTTQRMDHSINIETYLNPGFYLNSTTSYNDYARLKKQERLDFENDSTSLVIGEQDTTTFTTFLHRSILSSVGHKGFNGQFGIEFLNESGTGERIIDSTSNSINKAVLRNYAAWIGLRYEASKKVRVLGNLRFGHNSKYKHPVIPSFHVDWKPTESWGLKFSYAHGFRAPSLKELHFNFVDINHFILGNTNLKAENSKNISLLFKYKSQLTKRSQLTLSTNFFYNNIENRIIISEYEPTKYNYQNLEKFETHGVSWELNLEWSNDLKIQSGFAFTRLYNIWSEDFESDKFTGLSEWQNTFEYQVHPIKTKFILTHRFIGRQIQFYQNDENILEEGFIGNYHLVNATLSKSFFRNKIFAAIGVKNLGDLTTVPFIGQNTGEHNSAGDSQLLNWGRTYFLKVNFSF